VGDSKGTSSAIDDIDSSWDEEGEIDAGWGDVEAAGEQGERDDREDPGDAGVAGASPDIRARAAARKARLRAKAEEKAERRRARASAAAAKQKKSAPRSAGKRAEPSPTSVTAGSAGATDEDVREPPLPRARPQGKAPSGLSGRARSNLRGVAFLVALLALAGGLAVFLWRR